MINPFFVYGGEFTDTTFKRLTGEPFQAGPFGNYQDAYDAWRAETWRNVDHCYHRLFLVAASDLSSLDIVLAKE